MNTANVQAFASAARSKFSREADRADLQLRLLVGHANLLDCLAVELEESEQEGLLNDQPHNLESQEADMRREPMRWADVIAHLFQDDSDSNSDSDSDGECCREDGNETGEDEEQDHDHTLLRWPSNRLNAFQPKLSDTPHHQPSLSHAIEQLSKPSRPRWIKRLKTIGEEMEALEQEARVVDPNLIEDLPPRPDNDSSLPMLPAQLGGTPMEMMPEAIVNSVIQETRLEPQLQIGDIDETQAPIIAVA